MECPRKSQTSCPSSSVAFVERQVLGACRPSYPVGIEQDQKQITDLLLIQLPSHSTSESESGPKHGLFSSSCVKLRLQYFGPQTCNSDSRTVYLLESKLFPQNAEFRHLRPTSRYCGCYDVTVPRMVADPGPLQGHKSISGFGSWVEISGIPYSL